MGALHHTELGQGVPLVLLHANPGDSQDFEAVMPALAQHHRVLALDWPGYGRSAMPPEPQAATVSLYDRALREFLAAMDLPPAIFIGNSIGGNVAARLAIEAPERVRALVLVAPGGFTPHNAFTRAFCAFQGSRFALSPHRFARLYLQRRSTAAQAMLQRAATEQASPQRLALNRAMWRSFARPESDLRQRAGGIQAPTLLLFGRHDPAIPAHRDGQVAARCLPSASCRVLPCGHAPFAEVPDLFLAEVSPFLSAVACAPAP